MSKDQVIAEAMELSLADRVNVAQALWENIHADLVETDESDVLKEAAKRLRELETGEVNGLTHEEMMASARRAIEYA